jgi:hypothetical protein
LKKFDDTTTPASPPAAVMSAVKHLLRPLVRLLVHFHVTFPTLSNLLKIIYVDVAEKEFRIGGKLPSDSRITLLTGVHRKDVRRFRLDNDEGKAEPIAATLGALLVSRWTGLKDYLDKEGHPLPLARLAKDNKKLSFEGLVESVSKDIRSRVILDEWMRLGIVHLNDDDQVVLDRAAFVPDTGIDEKAYFLGRNLRDHIAACTHNLTEDSPPLMERSVYYDELTPADVAELEKFCKQQGMHTLQEINRRALELQTASKNNPAANQRMNFGVYFYHAEDTDDEESEK